MALALARKYRPRRFSDLLVQDHVAMVLRGAVVTNRVGHGYLLTGPRGVGKTTAARILAMALNCERKGQAEPAGEPCGECESCQRIWAGSAGLDVVEIDAASNRGVDDARDLRERAMYAASREGHHKVYIVDEAHMLTREAWNALLKILEEPPPGVVFVFATTEPQKIAQTAAPVMSRLQRFDFRRIGQAEIRKRIRAVLEAEGMAADDDAVTIIARQAGGGMRDALSLLDQCRSFGDGPITAERVREILGLVAEEAYGEALTAVADHDPAAIFTLLDRLDQTGADLIEFLAGLGEAIRTLLMLLVGVRPEGLTEALEHGLQGVRSRLAQGDLVRMLKLLAEAEPLVRRSGSPRMVVETLLLRWTLMDRMVDLQQVLSGGGQGSPPSGPQTPARAASQAPSPPPPPPPLPPPSPPARGSAPMAPGPALQAPQAPVPVPTGVPFTHEGLSAAWSDLVAAARAQGRFLGEVMAATRVTAVDPPAITVALTDQNPIHREGLDRQRPAIEALLAKAVGAPTRLTLDQGGAGTTDRPKGRRLSDAESRLERLKVLQGRDPALEAAAETLDLEVLE